MAITLKVRNNFELEAEGLLDSGKQGNDTDLITDQYSLADSSITIAGTAHRRRGILATATVVTAYTAANDFPATFDYLFFWADVNMCLQIIGSATEVRHHILAKVPFTLSGFGALVASAGTSIITGGTEPTYTAVSKIVIGNYSGGSGNYLLTLVD